MTIEDIWDFIDSQHRLELINYELANKRLKIIRKSYSESNYQDWRNFYFTSYCYLVTVASARDNIIQFTIEPTINLHPSSKTMERATEITTVRINGVAAPRGNDSFKLLIRNITPFIRDWKLTNILDEENSNKFE